MFGLFYNTLQVYVKLIEMVFRKCQLLAQLSLSLSPCPPGYVCSCINP